MDLVWTWYGEGYYLLHNNIISIIYHIHLDNKLFADDSWYFRNALVLANYRNLCKGIELDMCFPICFFRNLIMSESNEVKNRYMVIDVPEKGKPPITAGQVQDKLETSSPAILSLINTLGEQESSIKEKLTDMG